MNRQKRRSLIWTSQLIGSRVKPTFGKFLFSSPGDRNAVWLSCTPSLYPRHNWKSQQGYRTRCRSGDRGRYDLGPSWPACRRRTGVNWLSWPETKAKSWRLFSRRHRLGPAKDLQATYRWAKYWGRGRWPTGALRRNPVRGGGGFGWLWKVGIQWKFSQGTF